MSADSSVPNEITFYAYDIRKGDSHYFIKYVTTGYLASGKITKSKFKEMQKRNDTAIDFMDELIHDTSITKSFEFIMLDSITSLEWQNDDSDMLVNFHNAQQDKPARENIVLNNVESRETFVEAVKQRANVPFEETEGEVSIWKLGEAPFCISGIGAIVLYFGIDSLLAGKEVVEANINGRNRAVKRLAAEAHNWLGPTNVCFIGAGIIIAAMVLWYFLCRNPPKKIIATAVRTSA